MLVHVLREYNVNKILLSHLGLWPYQNKFVRNVLPILYLVILQMTIVLLQVLALCDRWGNIQEVFEICHHIVTVMIFVVKLFNEFWNHDKIRYLYEAMENHWNVFTSEIEIRILKDYSMLTRKCIITYSIITYVSTVLFLMVPFKPILLDIIRPLNESRPRIFVISEIEWGMDKDKYFVLIFCYTTSVIVMGATIFVAVDSIYITRTVHACSLFSIISQQLEKVTSKLGIDKLSEQVTYQEYVICLKKYQLALEFVNVMNSMYGTVALIMPLVTGAVISLVGVRMVVYGLNQLEQVMRFGLSIIGMLMHFLILCYSGQKLMDESQNVFYRAYAAKWYTFSPRLKSLLIITLYRSFKPCGLTAGNIFSLSMATYAAVIRIGISYFMTFLSLKD